MKKLLFAAAAMVMLSMLAPGTGFAEPTHPNEVGRYTNDDGTGATGIYGIGTLLEVYLVLTRPTDTLTGNPYTTINAFECRLNFNPIGDLFKLGEILPPESINIGESNNIMEGYLEYVVGIGTDWPVTDESVVLVHFLFMHFAPGVIEVTLGPISNYNPSIPDHMAFQSLPGHLLIMHSMGGCHECPVFLFEGEAVAVENETFGSVKALYR